MTTMGTWLTLHVDFSCQDEQAHEAPIAEEAGL